MTTPSASSAAEVALISRAVEGDRAALATLASRLMPVLCARARVARSLSGGLGTQHGADDLVQELWMALMRDEAALLRAYDPARGATLEGYVGMIARRELGNLAQRTAAAKRGAHLTAVDDTVVARARTDAPSPEQAAETRELIEQLSAHLASTLPARAQLILQATFVDGASAPDVARALQVNVQVVYNWQHKIREAARRFLAGAADAAPTR